MNNKALDLTTDRIRKIMDAEYGNELDFIGKGSDYRDEVENGNIFRISKYGLRLLDFHCPWKSSHLTLNVGHPNVGKSELDFFLLVNLARTSDQRFVIHSAENRIGAIVKIFISYYYGLPYKALSATQKNDGFEWIDAHFMFILHLRLYTYKEILVMDTRITDQGFEHDGILIDPYNALRVDLRGNNKNDYNIQACSEMQIYCESTGKSILMNCHTTTEAQRQRDKDGNNIRPMSADVEGGGPFTSKADDVFVTHRNPRDQYNWMKTELYVEKIRNQEYGGMITGFKEPIVLIFRRDRSGFDIEPTIEERKNAQQFEVSTRRAEPKDPNQAPLFEAGQEDLPF